MNATLQQLFMVPSFRDGLLSAAPPPSQRTPILSELQRTFAHLRDGLRPVFDPKALVAVCSELPMTYEPFQQNDAAEFLMLLTSHIEDALKGTRHADLLRHCFGGQLVQQVIWEEEEEKGAATPATPATPPAATASAEPTPSAAGSNHGGGGGASSVAATRKVSERVEDFVTIQLEVKGKPTSRRVCRNSSMESVWRARTRTRSIRARRSTRRSASASASCRRR